MGELEGHLEPLESIRLFLMVRAFNSSLWLTILLLIAVQGCCITRILQLVNLIVSMATHIQLLDSSSSLTHCVLVVGVGGWVLSWAH